MKRDRHTTKVIFRWYQKDGECIALFPQMAMDYQGWLCSSYMHVGQHGSADPQVVVSQTRLATKLEYAALAKELRQRGYRLYIRKRCTKYDLLLRMKGAKI